MSPNTPPHPGSPFDKKLGEFEEEKDPGILARRRKQIEYGKNTPEYMNYIKAVPREKRQPFHPKTPNVRRKYSRRAFDGLMRQWRLNLHVWSDTPNPNPELLQSENSIIRKRRNSTTSSVSTTSSTASSSTASHEMLGTARMSESNHHRSNNNNSTKGSTYKKRKSNDNIVDEDNNDDDFNIPVDDDDEDDKREDYCNDDDLQKETAESTSCKNIFSTSWANEVEEDELYNL